MLIDFLKNLFNIHNKPDEVDLFTLASIKLKDKVNNSYEINSLKVSEYEKEKASKLKEIGLVNSQFVIEVEDDLNKINYINKIKNLVNYYSKSYPHNPFIVFGQVNDICRENNYVFCQAKEYTKHIPDSNYSNIKNFKLKEEDKCYHGINITQSIVSLHPLHHPYNSGFELANKNIFDSFNGNNPDRMLLLNKKKYFDNFPILICTQPYNLTTKQPIQKSSYNIKHGHTVILKPVYKDSIYGFLIISVIKDTEAYESK